MPSGVGAPVGMFGPENAQSITTEPAQKRPLNGPNAGDYTLDKDVYVEEIGEASPSTAGVGQVVRRDLPYLVR